MDPSKVSVVQAQLFMQVMGDEADKFMRLLNPRERRLLTARWINLPENTYGLKVVGVSVRKVINDNMRWFAYMAQNLRPIIRLDLFRNRTYTSFCDYVESQGGIAVEWITTLDMFRRLEGYAEGDPEELRSELWRLSRLDNNL